MTNATIKFNYNGSEIELPIYMEPERVDELVRKAGIEKQRITGYERVLKGEDYWYIGDNLDVCVNKDMRLEDNEYHDTTGNYFSDEGLALQTAYFFEIWLKIRRYAAQRGYLVSRDSRANKYCIFWDNVTGKLGEKWSQDLIEFGQLYFNSKEAAREIINEFGDEIKEVIKYRETLERAAEPDDYFKDE